jgi:hypothetical protein
MNITCSACGSQYTTVRSKPETWGCPCTVRPRFTVAPDKTKFVPAKGETSA